jgi:pantothenate kinase
MSTLGREIVYTVTYHGHIIPTGQRASLKKITRRTLSHSLIDAALPTLDLKVYIEVDKVLLRTRIIDPFPEGNTSDVTSILVFSPRYAENGHQITINDAEITASFVIRPRGKILREGLFK